MTTESTRLDKHLLEAARKVGEKCSRGAPKQVEHWARLGQLMEQNPTLVYAEIHQLLLKQAIRQPCTQSVINYPTVTINSLTVDQVKVQLPYTVWTQLTLSGN